MHKMIVIVLQVSNGVKNIINVSETVFWFLPLQVLTHKILLNVYVYGHPIGALQQVSVSALVDLFGVHFGTDVSSKSSQPIPTTMYHKTPTKKSQNKTQIN